MIVLKEIKQFLFSVKRTVWRKDGSTQVEIQKTGRYSVTLKLF